MVFKQYFLSIIRNKFINKYGKAKGIRNAGNARKYDFLLFKMILPELQSLDDVIAAIEKSNYMDIYVDRTPCGQNDFKSSITPNTRVILVRRHHFIDPHCEIYFTVKHIYYFTPNGIMNFRFIADNGTDLLLIDAVRRIGNNIFDTEIREEVMDLIADVVDVYVKRMTELKHLLNGLTKCGKK